MTTRWFQSSMARLMMTSQATGLFGPSIVSVLINLPFDDEDGSLNQVNSGIPNPTRPEGEGCSDHYFIYSNV